VVGRLGVPLREAPPTFEVAAARPKSVVGSAERTALKA